MKKLSTLQWIVVGCTGIFLLAVAVVVYLFFNSHMGIQSGDVSKGQPDTSKTQRTEADNRAISDYKSPAEAVNELAKIDSVFQRTASIYKYLADVDNNELVDLLSRSEAIERNSIRTSIQTPVIRKLTTVNPDEALRWIADIPKLRRVPMLEGVFIEWSLTNLEDAVKGAKTLDGIDRQTALKSILSTRKDLSPSTLLDVAGELALEEFARRQISANQTLNLLDEPSAAWDMLVNDSVEDVKQLDLLRRVATAWKEQEGFDVLLRATEFFPNENDRTAFSKVIEDVVGDDLKGAFEYVRNLSQDTRGALPRALAMAAARVDPELALEEIAAWSDDPIHIHLQKIASSTWAQTDPREMLNKLELVPQVARAKALEVSFTHLASVSPRDAIKNLERAHKFIYSKVTLPAIIAEQWSHTDPEAALEWSISYAGSKKGLRQSLIWMLFTNLVESDIEQALDLAGEIPSTYNAGLREASYDVVMKLAQIGRIDDAISRLPMLDKNAKFFAIQNLGSMLVRAGEPYAAVVLGANIPTPDVIVAGPVRYFSTLFELWSKRDPQQLFDSLPSLTSPLLRSMAARALLSQQKSRPILSKESIKDAEALLSKYPVTENLHLLELQLQDKKGLIDLDQMVLPADWTE